MNVIIEKEIDFELDFDLEILFNDIALETIKYSENADSLNELEVNVLISDDENIRGLNKEFRNIDKKTDVLSFPMFNFLKPFVFEEIVFNDMILGDIVISIDTALEQAKDYGHSLKRELAFLFTHGLLHLFGFDHIDDNDRIIMESKQNQILKALNITRE